jgi:tetrahydromethanopterin S-methyltransferase subunit F
VSAQPVERDRPAETIAGFLAAVAIVAALLSLAYRPIRLDPFAIVVALIAAGIGGRHQRLAAIAVATASACFILGMVIAILAEKPLF